VPGHLVTQELERDLATQFQVEGLPDDTHPALAELLDQAVVEQSRSWLIWHSEAIHRGRLDRFKHRLLDRCPRPV
jgi:hypothetical protein